MLATWTIYDHPTDFPDHYVAREFVDGKPTESFIQGSELDTIRQILIADFGLTCIPRDPTDDPVIVETWV